MSYRKPVMSLSISAVFTLSASFKLLTSITSLYLPVLVSSIPVTASTAYLVHALSLGTSVAIVQVKPEEAGT
jgi:hypothetical protein